MAYAETTTVPFEKSIAEIIGLVRKHGAEQIGQMELPDNYVIGFRLADRMVRFTLPFPTLEQMPKRDGRNSALTDSQRMGRLDQAKRQRGRALMLVIKAKLESVESGIETIEEAFLANIVGADSRTVYERIKGPLALEYEQGRAVGLLPDYSG